MGGKSFVQAGDWDGHGAFGLHRLCCVRNRLWYNSAMKQGEENGSGERARAVDRYLHTGSFEAFRSTFLSGLVLAFFGIGFYRLWYQFNFYNLHFSADVGMVTMGIFFPLQGWMMAIDGILIGARDYRYLAVTCTLTAVVYVTLILILANMVTPALTSDLMRTAVLWAAFNVVLMGGRGLSNGLRVRSDAWMR